jgi:prepilin-type N-terminal cleavage/methylation domain-containing protein
VWPRRRGKHDRGRGQRGFTLIEALVALGVLAATIALVNRTFAAGWSAVRHGSLESRAIALAKAQIESAGVDIALSQETSNGVEDVLRWRRDITLYDPPGQTAGATARMPTWWVRIEVAWRDTPFAAERVLTLTTLKHGRTRP